MKISKKREKEREKKNKRRKNNPITNWEKLTTK